MVHVLSCRPARPAFKAAQSAQAWIRPAAPLQQLNTTFYSSHRASLVSPTRAQIKKRKAFGEWLIETDDASSLDQPPTSDFWEGAQFEIIGKTAGFAIPVIVVLLVFIGFFAASSYGGGATSVMRPAGSPEDTGSIVPIEELQNDKS